MIGDGQVAQVVRAAANGDGDWADVPRCVREAMVLALAGPQSQRCRGVWARDDGRPAAPSLAEETIQSSVRTFEDAAWLRDQAVRSFAQFHNTVEAMREAMRHHLRALWRTAAQLDPRLLGDVRRELRLGPRDDIPDDTPVPGGALERLTGLEAIVDEIEEYVHALRGASVRFAANALSDDEKRAMGLDPADLRPEDVTPCCTQTRRGTSVMRTIGSRAASGDDKKSPTPLTGCHERREQETPERSSEQTKAKNKLSHSEVRQRYMNQIALLNEASLQQVAEDVIAYRLSSHSSTNSDLVRLFASSTRDPSP